MRIGTGIFVISGAAVLGVCTVFAGAGEKVDFSKDVRPILAAHCMKCHGPDDKQRSANLRLDLAEGAYKLQKSGRRAVVPGKPEESELIKRIGSSGALLMPPAHVNKPLSGAQKSTLRKWIAGGAKYEAHWSFVAPKRSVLPPVKQSGWVRNPIDRFVLAKLESAGIKPSREADRSTLIRRVSLDLTGLPPTPEEAEAFAQDKRPDAYERVVDRLLASPHYGERWARRWMDLARYADTNGYEKDRPRTIWPYRDWVINALNADMPFDQFTIEQLAGDMLPGATQDQKIATGFHRNTMLNEEGGIDPNEFRFYSMTDRILTTGTTWLGLTIGCAQCHTHKYDPVTHKEYYRLLAFLNNADEPELEIMKPDAAARRAELLKQVADREAGLAEKFPAADGLTSAENLQKRYELWQIGASARAMKWELLRPSKASSNLPLLTQLPDGSILSSGDQTKRDVYELVFKNAPKGITAIKIEVLPDTRLPRNGPGRIFYEGPFGDLFLSEVQLQGASGTSVKFKDATQSSGSPAKNCIDGNPQTGWSINGGQGKAHTAVFNLPEPLSESDFTFRMIHEIYYAAGTGRFRIYATTDSRAATATFPTDVEENLLTPARERLQLQNKMLMAYYLSVAPELAKAREEIQKLRAQLPDFTRTLVMQERPKSNPRPTYVHNRGEFLQPKERVQPGVLAVLNPLPKEEEPNRLNFARWLVSKKNPLTARVTVNRQWQAFFGRGIVATLEDFGYQGELPSHPDLLDWLAVEFMQPTVSKKPWSLKGLHRLIVTSATYRQSSAVDPRVATRDPQNRLLARGPRVRLEAEMLRDTVLSVSGLLSKKIGGPSVFPPQPASVTSEGAYGALAWTVSQGEDRYRRGLYTFMKRTAPYAMFTTFDAPSGEACVARREVSNTPLQALTLLNDQVFVEAAQALGKLMEKREGSMDDKVGYLFQRILTRKPAVDELQMLSRFLSAQMERFEKKELDPATVAGGSEGDVKARAAWTTLARSLMNVDEAVVKR